MKQKLYKDVCLACNVPLELHGTCCGENNMSMTLVDCKCGGKILMQGSKVVSTCNRCTNIINLNNKS
jgi:hypothetical protein